MGKPAKPVSTVNKKTHKKSNSELDDRLTVEQSLQVSTRNLICPSHLPHEAKVEWARIVVLDNDRKTPVIYDSDLSILRTMCVLWAAFVECETAFIQNPKMMIKVPVKMDKNNRAVDDEYKLVTNPAYAEMRKLAKDMKPLYTAFALTPQGRSQFGVDKTKKMEQTDEEIDNDDISIWYK